MFGFGPARCNELSVLQVVCLAVCDAWREAGLQGQADGGNMASE